MTKQRTLSILATGAFASFMLTGCMAPGWDGDATVTEIELLNAEREGKGVEHDGVDITVLTDRGTEASVTVADCDPDKLDVEDRVSVADVERECENPVGYSEDE